MSGRIVEAYVGEYASGKSECAINRAVTLGEAGHKVTLVDLDLVEPFYTLRPLKKDLTKKGLEVVAWQTKDTLGLGEAGSTMLPAVRWVLFRARDIILDIGYGVQGTKVLNLVEGADRDPDLKILAVINVSRPITSTVHDIVEFVRELGRIDGLINNTHMGEDTSLEWVLEGERIVIEAGQLLQIPVVATYVEERFGRGIESRVGQVPVRFIHRFMPNSFW